MKKFRNLLIAIGLFILFVVFTLLVSKVDVQPIGPNGSSVGFAGFNKAVHETIGEHLPMYTITDWASVLAIPVGATFAVIGVVEWIKRKSLFKVDANILALGIFYILTFASYLFFELVVINRRPVLIEGILEASYPSSTTVLALTVFITAIDQIVIYIKSRILKSALISLTIEYCLFLIIGRIVSGVHWASDIIGAMILSSALIMSYYGIKNLFEKDENNPTKTQNNIE